MVQRETERDVVQSRIYAIYSSFRFKYLDFSRKSIRERLQMMSSKVRFLDPSLPPPSSSVTFHQLTPPFLKIYEEKM